jgi:hypothetical protein
MLRVVLARELDSKIVHNEREQDQLGVMLPQPWDV